MVKKLNYLSGSIFNSKFISDFNRQMKVRFPGFEYGFLSKPKSKLKFSKDTLVLVFSGKDEIEGGVAGKIKENDLLYLKKGNYKLKNPKNLSLFLISGEKLFRQSKIIKESELKKEKSTLGGMRKMLKNDDGKFNVDVHMIWVDDKNKKIPHYHEKLAELYLVCRGEGKINLGEHDLEFPKKASYSVSPKFERGTLVAVLPPLVHKAEGHNLMIQVFGIPAFYHQDVYLLKE